MQSAAVPDCVGSVEELVDELIVLAVDNEFEDDVIVEGAAEDELKELEELVDPDDAEPLELEEDPEVEVLELDVELGPPPVLEVTLLVELEMVELDVEVDPPLLEVTLLVELEMVELETVELKSSATNWMKRVFTPLRDRTPGWFLK